MQPKTNQDHAVSLSLTLEQAQVVARALDLYARLGMGQWGELAHLVNAQDLRPQAPGVSVTVDWVLALEDKIKDVSRHLGHGGGAHMGIGAQSIGLNPKRAYEVKKVLERELAMHNNPKPVYPGVQYDGLSVRYTDDVAPVARVYGATHQEQAP